VSPHLPWVTGTVLGFSVALGFPPGFEEALKFILPGYFAGLLVVEMKGWMMPLVCAVSLIAAIPSASASPSWGWLVVSCIVAFVGWGSEEWNLRAARSS
jgi:predicted branched-subunit amino acid permease